MKQFIISFFYRKSTGSSR